ncbi:hypothetical protein [Streptomyces sp. NPDC018693]|uniref:hypothetical protein n=1 Tax=unclassified Streptomyces TaxID=2593676 RepID=UPI00378D3A7A
MSVSEPDRPFGGGPQDERGSCGGEGAGSRGRASGLPEELRALGRSLGGPGDGAEADGGADGAETMVERVLGQILAERLPVPEPEPPAIRDRLRAARRWTRTRWRSLTASLCGLLAILALTPPVRAAVVDWFDFAGVEVRYDPSATPDPDAEVPGCGRSVSLAEAARRAGFEPVVPASLGTPDAVSVTAEPGQRFLVSLCWREQGRVIRLDEYPARLDIGFTKAMREQPEWIPLGEVDPEGGADEVALWFARPHLLGFWMIDDSGGRFEREERTAGPTLLWEQGDGTASVTLRLEGVTSRARAVEIAMSLR